MFKYNTKLNKEISRVVRNYNSKISRLSSSDSILNLPNKITVKEIKDNSLTKWDLNRQLKNLQLFSKRGIEKTVKTKGGLETSKYELELIKREQRRLIRKLDLAIKKTGEIIPTTYGIPEDVSYAQMGSEQLSNMKARRMAISRRRIGNLSKEGLKELISLMNRAESYLRTPAETFMDNYIQKMIGNLGYFYGYNEEKMSYIKEQLMKLSPKQFIKLFNTEESIRQIAELYPDIHNANPTQRDDIIRSDFERLYENIDSIIKDYQ